MCNHRRRDNVDGAWSFSILERIVVCATADIHRVAALGVPFSILERIVVCATPDPDVPAIYIQELSVSSNGSWCVQLLNLCQTTIYDSAFSILERIVVCATLVSPDSTGFAQLFQYPRTDRGVCNMRNSDSPKLIQQRLSVSSNGSWCVQLSRCESSSAMDISFSILERIVVCATRDQASFSLISPALSVSSNGSWCVQRADGWKWKNCWLLSVSSNGSWCVQLCEARAVLGSLRLSVSSNGSWCVQPS